MPDEMTNQNNTGTNLYIKKETRWCRTGPMKELLWNWVLLKGIKKKKT